MISINGKASYIGAFILQITTGDNLLLAIKQPNKIPRLTSSIKDYLRWNVNLSFFVRTTHF